MRKTKQAKTAKTLKQQPRLIMLETPTAHQFEPHHTQLHLQTEFQRARGGSGQANAKRRSNMCATSDGHTDRVIRKRMRKTGNQLDTLQQEFDRDPHWSKETLYLISQKTSLTEA